MTAQVTEITVEPNDDIISQLEDLLLEAKSGNLIELAGAAVLKNNSTILFDSGYRSSVTTMYGAIMDAALTYREHHLG